MSEPRPVWEPFVPAVGQRVRVRTSPECEQEWPADSWFGKYGIKGHLPGENGATGTVWMVFGLKATMRTLNHHRFLVVLDSATEVPSEYDVPDYLRRVERPYVCCASVELAPLEEGE